MKKILTVAAAAGLMTLAACEPTATNTAENVAESHEANATAYDAMADNASNEMVEETLENAADVEENAADTVEANAM